MRQPGPLSLRTPQFHHPRGATPLHPPSYQHICTRYLVSLIGWKLGGNVDFRGVPADWHEKRRWVKGHRVTPTKPGHRLQCRLQADLLQPQVAVAEQAAPQEHPVQACPVIHDDDATLARDEAIAGDHHLHAKHQLQQCLRRGPNRPRQCHRHGRRFRKLSPRRRMRRGV